MFKVLSYNEYGENFDTLEEAIITAKKIASIAGWAIVRDPDDKIVYDSDKEDFYEFN